MKCALYRVVHRESGKDYVGISVRPRQRWQSHLRACETSKLLFHRALKKHGESAFDWQIISWSSQSGAKILEQLAIHLGWGYYNLTKGGEGTAGLRWSEESRLKQSEACKGRRLSSAARAKLSLALQGNTRRVGKSLSAETKAKMSAVRRGRPAWNKGRKQPRKEK